jgi:hypothetical protein
LCSPASFRCHGGARLALFCSPSLVAAAGILNDSPTHTRKEEGVETLV